MRYASFTPLARGRYRCNVEDCKALVKKGRTEGHANGHFYKGRSPPPPTMERIYQRSLRAVPETARIVKARYGHFCTGCFHDLTVYDSAFAENCPACGRHFKR
jgi:hypothetical protein